MARPTGITVLGGLQIFSGVTTTVLGVVFLRSPGSVSGMGIPPDFVALGPVLGVVLIISGVFNLVLGWGLLRLFNWARVVMVVIAALSLGGAAIGILVTHDTIGMDLRRLLLFALYGVIVWYLLRPECKQAFTAHPPGRQPGAPPSEPPSSAS